MKLSFSSITHCLFVLLSIGGTSVRLSAAPTAAYPQPDASDREQYILELINAARANPAGEGQRLATVTDSEILRYYNYYHVSTNELVGDFGTYASKPPLAFNASLMASSHQHAAYQAQAGVQSHESADGTTFDKRISAAGYKWSGLGENVYAYAENPFFGHVGLNADWGVPSYGHRENIMNSSSNVPTFREVGIACVDSSIHDFGPLVITQDFGTPADSSLAYVTGVVYQDANGNGVYDEGEGLAGVTITPDAGNYYAVTTGAGGFQVPLPASGAGTLTVTASGGGLGSARVKAVAYSAGNNVKLDFTTNDASGAGLPTVTLAATAKDAIPNAQAGQVVVAREGDISRALKVFLTYSGDAVSGVDYAPLPAKVTIPAGASSVSLDVQPTNASRVTAAKLKVAFQVRGTYRVTPDASHAKVKVRIWPAQ